MSLQFIRNVSFSNTSVFTIMLGLSIASPTFGDGPSTAATGINSQGLGLDGTGVSIGQVEVDRVGSTPAVSPFDDTAHSNATVIPAAVFLHDGNPIQNQNIDVHPEHVAGIMISSDAQHLSVAPLAAL